MAMNYDLLTAACGLSSVSFVHITDFFTNSPSFSKSYLKLTGEVNFLWKIPSDIEKETVFIYWKAQTPQNDQSPPRFISGSQ